MDDGDGCTAMWMHLTPQSYILKMIKMVDFMLHFFCHNKKKFITKRTFFLLPLLWTFPCETTTWYYCTVWHLPLPGMLHLMMAPVSAVWGEGMTSSKSILTPRFLLLGNPSKVVGIVLPFTTVMNKEHKRGDITWSNYLVGTVVPTIVLSFTNSIQVFEEITFGRHFDILN